MRCSARTVILFAGVAASTLLFAQANFYKSSILISQVASDYNAVLLGDKPVALDSNLSFSHRIAYQRRFSNKWHGQVGLANGYRNYYSVGGSNYSNLYQLGLDFGIKTILFGHKKRFEPRRLAPFITVGYQLDYLYSLRETNHTVVVSNSQYGAGVYSEVSRKVGFQASALITQKLQDNFNTFLQYRAGIYVNLGRANEIDYEPIQDDEINQLNTGNQEFLKIVADSLISELERKDTLLSNLLTDLKTSQQRISSLRDTIQEVSDGESARYFVIVASSKDLSALNSLSLKFSKSFYSTLIIEREHNKGYRLGIEAGYTSKEAQDLLNLVRSDCCPDAWLLYQ